MHYNLLSKIHTYFQTNPHGIINLKLHQHIHTASCLISGFHHHDITVFTLLGFYTVLVGSCVPMSRGGLSVPHSMVKRSDYLTAEEMGPTGSAETLVNNSNQHLVKTQKSKYSNFMLVKKKDCHTVVFQVKTFCSTIVGYGEHTASVFMQYYSWIRTFQGNILPLSSCSTIVGYKHFRGTYCLCLHAVL